MRKANVTPIIEYGILVVAGDGVAFMVLLQYLAADSPGNAGRNEEKEAAAAQTANAG